MFAPFESRVSREIRNRLSQGFIDTLEGDSWPVFELQAAALRQNAPDEDHTGFIDTRMAIYHKVYGACAGRNKVEIARLLWDHALFFECHEWVEALWLIAEGPEKKALQSIIRAAGAHVLAEAGRERPAASSALKAQTLITVHRDLIPAPFTPKLLLDSLAPLLTRNG